MTGCQSFQLSMHFGQEVLIHEKNILQDAHNIPDTVSNPYARPRLILKPI